MFSQAEVEWFKTKLSNTGIHPVFSHVSYLPNLSSSVEARFVRSVDAFTEELKRCNLLRVPYLVTHLGSHLGKGLDTGIKQVVKAIDSSTKRVEDHPMILLENTSGKTNEVGSTFEEINNIIQQVSTDNVGVCLDTCHAFARGYDISNRIGVDEIIDEIEDTVGVERVKLVHINDSRGELGSRMDRHNHIGLGKIGVQGFIELINSELGEKPLVLETPVDDVRSDADNLMWVRQLS